MEREINAHRIPKIDSSDILIYTERMRHGFEQLGEVNSLLLGDFKTFNAQEEHKDCQLAPKDAEAVKKVAINQINEALGKTAAPSTVPQPSTEGWRKHLENKKCQIS